MGGGSGQSTANGAMLLALRMKVLSLVLVLKTQAEVSQITRWSGGAEGELIMHEQ